MVQRFRNLEQMRAERERAENELLAPYQAELRRAASIISDLKPKAAKVDLAEQMLGSDISRAIADEIGHRLGEAILREVKPEYLADYREKAVPHLRVGLDRRMDEMTTVVDVRIPPLAIRRMIAQRAFG